MPRLTESRVPSYRLHKQSGQAIVTLNGRDICLGKHDTPQSKSQYNRLLSEWIANGRFLPPSPQAVTILEIADAFLKHAEIYYRDAEGEFTSEVFNYRSALKPLLKLYADMPAAEFGPLCLKAVREKMIELEWCRKSVNDQTARIKHMFKWAVENELVPPSIYHGLLAVSGLKVGRSGARESKPVLPVTEEHVASVLKHVSRQVAAMIRLQFLTGMRPGEVCAMRGSDIDMSSATWVYQPVRHKTAHHGHARTIYLGPQAQEIIRPFLRPNLTEYLFSPADAERERREAVHTRRKTPLNYGNVPGSNRKHQPKRRPADRYRRDSYARAIEYACQKAFPLPAELARQKGQTHTQWKIGLTPEKKGLIRQWRREHRFHPHQLRHTAATRLRKQFGLEAAQVILGHKTLTVTQVYAEKNIEAALKIMAQVG